MREALPRQLGRFELVAEIGRGGMAQLYLGRLVGIAGFARRFAIKCILPHLSEDKRFVEMFLNEGRIAGRLTHTNICQVFELGEDDGELYLAMEYLEGVQWDQLIEAAVAAGSVRDPVAILRLAACTIGQACDGLHYAHELRDSQGRPTPVIHRDISPGNLFVTIDGTCKVLDFGVSKMTTENDDTRSGLVKGKLAYMPPEQLKGENVDARVDVFAMAAVLWESLAGKRLFMRENDYQIYQAVIEEPIPPLAHLFPGSIGLRIDALLARGLARDRDQRYDTIRAFADDLRSLVTSLGGTPSVNEVGNLVRDTFEQKLAERSHLIAQLSAVYDTREEDTKIEGSPAAEPSVTRSVIMRDASLAVARRPAQRRRWYLFAIPVALLAAAIVIGLVTRTDDAPATSPAVRHASIDAGLPDMAPIAAIVDDAGTPDATLDDIEIDPPPSQTHRSVTRRTPPADSRPGFYSIDSRPYAVIFVDGRKLDATPLYRVELPPGRHQIRATLADGRSRSFTIKIAPGKQVTSGTLRW
jgi:serine/threonine-protein kinase